MAKIKDTHEPELVIKEGQPPFYLSDDGHGTPIAWERCHGESGGCGKPLMDCNCKGGPKEPYYITRWRHEALGIAFEKVRSTASHIGTSVRSTLRPSKPAAKSMSDFIDQDVIDKVKAASQTPEDQR